MGQVPRAGRGDDLSAAAAPNLPTGDQGCIGLPPGTRFHDLRHTYASALIASGCSVKVVQAHLGHKSAAMTLDIYSHLWPQDDDRARAAVQSFFSGDVSWVCHDEASG